MGIKDIFGGLNKDLDKEVEFGYKVEFFKGGKLRVIIINEDNSAREFFRKFPKSYIIEIKGRDYFATPSCILRLKHPTLAYYYNNPFPIGFKYEASKVTALSLRSDEAVRQLEKLPGGDEELKRLANVTIDAELLKTAFNSNAFRLIYARDGMNTRTLLMIIGAVVVGILVILQVTGMVDIIGGLNGILT